MFSERVPTNKDLSIVPKLITACWLLSECWLLPLIVSSRPCDWTSVWSLLVEDEPCLLDELAVELRSPADALANELLSDTTDKRDEDPADDRLSPALLAPAPLANCGDVLLAASVKMVFVVAVLVVVVIVVVIRANCDWDG